MQYDTQYKQYLDIVNSATKEAADKVLGHEKVAEAAKYSLFAGGKRVRGVLAVSVCDMLCTQPHMAAQYAAAVEMLHCYSLIHDDLPCMDNDNFRRGKPSCHCAYGESTALLAGDALLTAAFEVTASAVLPSAAQNVLAVKALAFAAGGNGMVYGQELDLNQNTNISEQQLCNIHTHKTGDLINAAVIMGAVAGNASEIQKVALSSFAYKIGLVFQIIDDILDVVSTSEQLGKPVGSDSSNDKTTFVTLKGVENCKKLAAQITKEACLCIEEAFEEKAKFLITFAENLLQRAN